MTYAIQQQNITNYVNICIKITKAIYQSNQCSWESLDSSKMLKNIQENLIDQNFLWPIFFKRKSTFCHVKKILIINVFSIEYSVPTSASSLKFSPNPNTLNILLRFTGMSFQWIIQLAIRGRISHLSTNLCSIVQLKKMTVLYYTFLSFGP